MADNSTIEWLHGHPGGKGATWNVITGCSLESPGCSNCYAMKLAGTRLRNHPSRQGLTVETKNGPVWNGEVRFNEQWLDQPLRWKAPRMIFVCAHGDLFHPAVQEEWIDRVFAVMAYAEQHTFLVLTKRADRMRTYFSTPIHYLRFRWARCLVNIWGGDDPDVVFDAVAHAEGVLPNVWLGVSIEDRKRMLERAPLLRDTPAALRWWSAEPLLGDLGDIADDLLPDWAVVGGESGADARPMNIHAVRRFRDRMLGARRPFFFKQWGEWLPTESADQPLYRGEHRHLGVSWHAFKVGKKAAGRMLDGVLYDQYPATTGGA